MGHEAGFLSRGRVLWVRVRLCGYEADFSSRGQDLWA